MLNTRMSFYRCSLSLSPFLTHLSVSLIHMNTQVFWHMHVLCIHGAYVPYLISEPEQPAPGNQIRKSLIMRLWDRLFEGVLCVLSCFYAYIHRYACMRIYYINTSRILCHWTEINIQCLGLLHEFFFECISRTSELRLLETHSYTHSKKNTHTTSHFLFYACSRALLALEQRRGLIGPHPRLPSSGTASVRPLCSKRTSPYS